MKNKMLNFLKKNFLKMRKVNLKSCKMISKIYNQLFLEISMMNKNNKMNKLNKSDIYGFN